MAKFVFRGLGAALRSDLVGGGEYRASAVVVSKNVLYLLLPNGNGPEDC